VQLDWLVNDFLVAHPEVRSRPFTTGAVTYELIKPAVATRGCRYVDLVTPEAAVSRGSPFFFISHGWGRPFVELVDQLVQHFSAESQALWRPRGEPALPWREIYVWLDVFAINQNEGTSQGDDLSQLKEVVEDSVQTLMVLDFKGLVLSRIWCLYEAWNTWRKGRGGLRLLAYGVRWEALEKVFLDVDVAKAQATVQSDLFTILDDIASDVGVMTMTHQLKEALVDSVVSAVPPPNDDGRDCPWTEELGKELYKAASICKLYGRLEIALSLHRRSLRGKEGALGAEHPETLSSMNSVAYILQLQGAAGEAEEMYRSAYEARMRVLGPEHGDTLTSLSCLASSLKDLGRLSESSVLFEKANEAYERVLGPTHATTLICLSQRGELCRLQGCLTDAEALQRRALEAREATLGMEHHHTLYSVHRLCLALLDKGDLVGAEALGRRAVEGRRKVLGGGHRDTAESERLLGRVAAARPGMLSE